MMKKNTEEQLAHRLREAREAAGLTQADVARRLGLSRSSVAQMELGQRGIGGLELDQLARIFGRDIGDFFRAEFRPEESLVAFFRAQARDAEDDRLSEAVEQCVLLARELARLEEILKIEPPRSRTPAYSSDPLKTKWQAIGQGNQIAEEERRRLSLGDLPVGDLAELLESQGIRTALLDLPDDISGLVLMEPSLSFFVVANASHPMVRRRFSWAHEYAHVLLDRDRRGMVSRASEREELSEVRANAFAAAFLMPEDGVREFLADLGKGHASRKRWDVFDEAEVLAAEGRREPGSQKIQLYDVVLLAHHFGTSRLSTLYRLFNLNLISRPNLDRLLEEEHGNRGKHLERLLRLDRSSSAEDQQAGVRDEFRTRFLTLALEAYRREAISKGKLRELAYLVDPAFEDLDQLLEDAGLGDEEDEVLLPRALR